MCSFLICHRGRHCLCGQIMRMELVCVPHDRSVPTDDYDKAGHPLPVLPSLAVGKEESGEAFCRGHREWFDPEDFQAALATVHADGEA